jgi:HEAT repeat protein
MKEHSCHRTAIGLAVVAALAAYAFGTELELEMYSDPKIALQPSIDTVSPETVELWLKGLAGPEADLKRQVAESIALAHERGYANLQDSASALMQTLQEADLQPVVAQAVARTLTVIDAHQAADLLLERALRDGPALAQVVEPALARWDYQPVRAVWLERLAAPDTRRRLLMLAIEGAETVREQRAGPDLLRLARSQDVPPDIRLAASKALGWVQTDGLERDARKLAELKSAEGLVDRMAAALMMAGHRGQPATTLLLELAVDPEPAVAAIALERLLEMDPQLVNPILGKTIASDDANVRRLGARALVAQPSPESVRSLAPMLDDLHPDVRGYVRRSLEEMASRAELADSVTQQATDALASDRWRQLEQAILLVANLDYKPAAPRCVELLEFERLEVFIAAAWGLGRLSVPDTLEPMFEKVRRETQNADVPPGLDENGGRQLCHLIQTLGRMKYAPCDPVLRQYVPKGSPFPGEARAAAIWALGHLHAGSPQDDLSRLLQGRLTDENIFNPELLEVRVMSAVSLGRMRCQDSLDALKNYVKTYGVNDPLGYPCAWAIHQITGDPMPEPQPHKATVRGWFLEPIE